MKNLLMFFLLLISFSAFSQKTKNKEIVSLPKIGIHTSIKYDMEGKPIDTLYIILAHNSKYSNIIDPIGLYTGDIKGLVKFLEYAIKFVTEEEEGTREKYNGQTLAVTKLANTKYILIYEMYSGTGYHHTTASALKDMLNKLEKWAELNKVTIR